MKTNDIQTIKQVANLLEQLNFEYWIDSGTLLGLYRDSKLIESDKDIDISIIQNENQINDLVELLKKKGFGKVFLKKYNNKIHKIKILRKIGQRTVDISIFRKFEDELLMPVLRLEKIFDNLKKFNFFIVVKLLFAKTFIILSKWLDYEIDFNSAMFKSLIRKKELWCYPSDMVLPSIKSSRYGFYYPKNTDSFLIFRYGDWKTPSLKWDTENSDKGFILDKRHSELL